MRYGDLVEYQWGAWPAERAYVFGEMSYSENGSHVIVANPGQIGMPLSSGHCRLISSGHETICDPIRAQYLERWPNALKPLTDRR